MKKEYALPVVLMLSLLVMPGLACAEIVCTAETSCSGGEVILELSSQTNAHAALPGQGSGYLELCCSGDGIVAGSSGSYIQEIIQLSANSNAHACAGCDVSPYSSHIARFSVDDPSVTGLTCSYVSPPGDCGSDSCILGMSSDTNAHVADCDSKPDNYGAICCAIVIDSVPPIVDDNYGVKEGVWQDESQNIAITATDADSGVDRISYAWAYDDCEQTGCNAISQTDSCVNSCSPGGSCSIQVTQNKNDDLCYFATDNAANPSDWENVSVKVDLFAPSTTCVNCPDNGQVVGQPFVITLDAKDDTTEVNKESGVDGTYICYFEGAGTCSYQDYTSPVVIGSSCPTQTCTYTVRYYSTDVAGNEESPYKQRIITYDKTAPSCTFSESLPDKLDTRAIHLEWSANDPVTTSTFVRYVITTKKSTDGGLTYTQVVGTPVTINTESQITHDFSLTEDGDFRFECEVTYDRSGSPITSSPGRHEVLVDTVNPVLQLTGSNPEYVNEETFPIGWTVDDINNIDYYVLEIDGSVVGGNIPGNYTSTQYAGSAGSSYDISVTAHDLVGNPSSPAEKTLTIDTEPPACSINPLSEYMNTTSFELEWSGSDDLSGIEHYEVCINTNGADCTSPTTGWDNLTDTSETFTGSHGNTYYFRIRAVDAAENTGTWSSQENTTIDAHPPEFAGTGPDYPSAMTSSDYEDMIVNATINDDVGIKDISLVMGSSEVQPEDINGSEGDTEWLVVWEIPYGTYMTETEFSITMTDVNSNVYTESFTYSVSECSPGDERECDPRDPSDPNKVYTLGVCRHSATKTCQADGTWGNCTGGTLPSSEDCNNLDDDCDGHVDESLASQSCGPSTDMGICEYGSRDCVNGSWTSCLNAVFPKAAEICGNDLDDNCNGQKEEGCVCTPEGDTQPCGESSIGACELGTKTCTGGVWGTCVGKIDPSTEICGDLIDNDCDTLTDCDDSDCVDSFECKTDPIDPVEEPFPWWMLSVIGVIILVVLVVLILYFKSQGEELSWETLKKKYSSVGFS